jgi:hypothetical protein
MTEQIHSNEESKHGERQGDGGTYLVIADNSDEYAIGAHYAARLANARKAKIAIAKIIDLNEFMHWGRVEELVRHDMRLQAEKDLWHAAKAIHDTHGLFPCLHIAEGQQTDKIIEIIETNRNIRALILSGSSTTGNPGPLVTHFSGKGMSNLRIPVVIVPGHLDKAAINAII